MVAVESTGHSLEVRTWPGPVRQPEGGRPLSGLYCELKAGEKNSKMELLRRHHMMPKLILR